VELKCGKADLMVALKKNQ